MSQYTSFSPNGPPTWPGSSDTVPRLSLYYTGWGALVLHPELQLGRPTMDKEPADLAGRRLERFIRRDRVIDEEFGHEFSAEVGSDSLVSFDGTVETVEHATRKLLPCNHLYQVGQSLAQCDACSKAKKRPVYVCRDSCSIVCPVTGSVLCLRCSRLGPDGRRYSPDGLKQAKKMGLFEPHSSRGTSLPSINTRCRGLLSWLLNWW